MRVCVAGTATFLLVATDVLPGSRSFVFPVPTTSYYGRRSLHALHASDAALNDSTDVVNHGSEGDIPLRSSGQRWKDAILRFDELDRQIQSQAVPNMINLGVVPLVNSVDTYWVGRLGVALALAGQAAANQAAFTLYFLVAFLPSITAPLVASAVASGNEDEAQARICESLFLCNALGLLGTAMMIAFPRRTLSSLVLSADAPAMQYAAPYLQWRALGMIPSLIAATGFSAYRGLLNTVTPLKISLMTNVCNLILDPVCIFAGRMGFVGAAVATAASELVSGLTYLRLLFRRRLVSWSRLFKPPSWAAIAPLLKGGASMLLRQVAINVGLIAAARRAQILDPTGVSGAAYGITMQIYAIGIVILVAIQSTAAVLVPAALAGGDKKQAQIMADRLLSWGFLVGTTLGVGQFLLLPLIVPIFSTLPEVREAVRLPALISSLTHVVNGPVFAGEGIMIGLANFRGLALVTGFATMGMVVSLASPLGRRLDGIMWSILISSVLQNIGVVGHYLKVGPLSSRCVRNSPSTTSEHRE